MDVRELTEEVVRQLRGFVPAGETVHFEVSVYLQPEETSMAPGQPHGLLAYSCPDYERIMESTHSAMPKISYDVIMPEE